MIEIKPIKQEKGKVDDLPIEEENIAENEEETANM